MTFWKLTALNRFIAKFGEIYLLFFKVMRKAARFEWTIKCLEAFEKVKQYLVNPPFITRPITSDSLLLYLVVVDHAVSAVLV
jgi:hypothetical protein